MLVTLFSLVALAGGTQLAFAACPCNPCPCDPCAKCDPCCDPCAKCDPCDPCAKCDPCDPCAKCDPCDKCAKCDPCCDPCNKCCDTCDPCCETWLNCECLEDYFCRIGLSECQKAEALKAIEEFKCETECLRAKCCDCESKCDCRTYRKALRDLDCKMKNIITKCQKSDYKCVRKEVKDQVKCCHKCLINPFKRCKCCDPCNKCCDPCDKCGCK